MSTEPLLEEIEESKRWLTLEKDESTYKMDLTKRIELINWVLENMKNPELRISELIESKMNEIIDTVNNMDSAIKADPLHRELRILDWILYQVSCNEVKRVWPTSKEQTSYDDLLDALRLSLKGYQINWTGKIILDEDKEIDALLRIYSDRFNVIK